jgi:sterol 3beta-glucosyltransferase
VCSFIADQPFWGRIVKRKGVGDTIPFKKLNLSAMLRLLPPLLTSEMRERAKQLGAQIREEDGAVRAADHIEAQSAVAGAP